MIQLLIIKCNTHVNETLHHFSTQYEKKITMNIKIIPIIFFILLSGCVTTYYDSYDKRDYLEHAIQLYEENNLTGAYRFLEDYFDDNNNESNRAVSFVKSKKRLMEAGFSTFFQLLA